MPNGLTASKRGRGCWLEVTSSLGAASPVHTDRPGRTWDTGRNGQLRYQTYIHPPQMPVVERMCASWCPPLHLLSGPLAGAPIHQQRVLAVPCLVPWLQQGRPSEAVRGHAWIMPACSSSTYASTEYVKYLSHLTRSYNCLHLHPPRTGFPTGLPRPARPTARYRAMYLGYQQPGSGNLSHRPDVPSSSQPEMSAATVFLEDESGYRCTEAGGQETKQNKRTRPYERHERKRTIGAPPHLVFGGRGASIGAQDWLGLNSSLNRAFQANQGEGIVGR